MEVKKDGAGGLNFTFRFVPGACDYSYATYTARKQGISPEVVQRADEVSVDFHLLLLCLLNIIY